MKFTYILLIALALCFVAITVEAQVGVTVGTGFKPKGQQTTTTPSTTTPSTTTTTTPSTTTTTTTTTTTPTATKSTPKTIAATGSKKAKAPKSAKKSGATGGKKVKKVKRRLTQDNPKYKNACRGNLNNCRLFDSYYHAYRAQNKKAKATPKKAVKGVKAINRYIFHAEKVKVLAIQAGFERPARHGSKAVKKSKKGKKSKKSKKGKKGKKRAKRTGAAKAKAIKKAGTKLEPAMSANAAKRVAAAEEAKTKKEATLQLRAQKTKASKTKKSKKAKASKGKKAGKGKAKKSKKQRVRSKLKTYPVFKARASKKLTAQIEDMTLAITDPGKEFDLTRPFTLNGIDYWLDPHSSQSTQFKDDRDRFVGISTNRRRFVVAERLFVTPNKWFIATGKAKTGRKLKGFVSTVNAMNTPNEGVWGYTKKAKKQYKLEKKAKKAKKAKTAKKDGKKADKKAVKKTEKPAEKKQAA